MAPTAKTILVVDDEFAMVENLTELLQDEGYRVVSAGNGKDGLERMQEERPTLVITDLMMPVADGRELLRGKQSSPELQAIPVVMMSATTENVALADAANKLNVDAFLQKPFRWETLLDTVVQLIGPGAK